MSNSALTTDFYELTMAQGYFLSGNRGPTVFDMFFRSHPFGGGFTVFAGLQPLLQHLEGLRFTESDIAYLRSVGIFTKEFLDCLSDFRFTGDLYAVPEGTVVFPDEPLIRVHADIMEAQLIESVLLNIINFQTLIATKSARIFLASGKGTVLEFGLRRAQGLDGAFSAARAAFIGGASATSNAAAAKDLGIPAKGTMAHSWVLAFDSELASFNAYADLYPDSSIFLIDTYDTLTSGIENAIITGKRLADNGKRFGVRLDSGDLLDLSVKVRRRLDEAGYPDAVIAASNELDEWQIEELVKRKAPIDMWGVGTRLVTGGTDSSLTGVYKLAAKGAENEPVMKVSESAGKSTNPGVKQVYRVRNTEEMFLRDLIALENEAPPVSPGNGGSVHCTESAVPLLELQLKGGKRRKSQPSPRDIQDRVKSELDRYPSALLSLRPASEYPVLLSEKLKTLKEELTRSYSDGA
jgi:nicotinate phosphoribosyltransferase